MKRKVQLCMTRGLVALFLFCGIGLTRLIAQTHFESGDGWGTAGWGSYTAFTEMPTSSGKYVISLQNSGTGNKYFRTSNGAGTNRYGPSGSSDIQLTTDAVQNTLEDWNAGQGKANYINVDNTSYTYVFKTNGSTSKQMRIFTVQGALRTISSVSRTSVYVSNDVTVTATISAALNTGQALYLRYTTNAFSTSTVVQLTGSGTTYTGTIPGQAAATSVVYYVFSSGDGGVGSGTNQVLANGTNADYMTLNINNNSGSNYSYTVSDYVSTQAGNWSSTSTWLTGSVPPSSASVIIAHDVTLDQDATVSGLTINSGATFTASDGSARTLTVSRTASASTLVNGGTWVNGSGGSTINFTGAGASADVIHTITGTYSLNNVVINKTIGSGFNVGVAFGTAVLANGGKLTIGNGGYLSSIPSGFYNTSGAICTLEFSNSGGYTINNGDATWPSSNAPSNITISSGAVVLNTARTATGNLTISGGSLTLGAALTINGDWTRASTATFTPSTNSVTLSGSSQQTITITGSGTCSMYGLIVNNSAGVLLSSSPATNLSVTNSLTLTSGTINANGNTITLSSGIAITRASGTLSVVPTFSGTSSVTYNTGGTTTDNELNNTVTTLACTNASGTITLKAGASVTATGVSTTSGGTLNVPSTSTLIVGASGVANSGALTVAGTFQINAGGFVNTNSPSYSGTSTLIYNTAGAYGRSNEWPSLNGPTNVTLSNSGTNLTLGAARTLTGTLTVNSGCTFASGSANLTLANGARIANSTGATFSGTVNVVFATTAKRAYRLLGHPFSSAIAMSQLTGTGEIDITGNATGASTSGTPCTGCTSTTSNAPSSFSYDPSTGNSGTNPDPGWTSFNDLSTSSWAQYQGARVLVRGAKGEGLTGAGYSPSATTITVTGAINDGGNKTITLTSGASSDYNLIANPFCSQINFGLIDAGQRTGVGSNFYTWDPALSTRGGYVTTSFNSSYILPIMGAVFVSKGSASNITISESLDKVSGSAQSLFKNDPNAVDQLAITVVSDTITWDFYKLRFRGNASNGNDDQDAIKFVNPELALSSLSSEGKKLAIDVRPVPANETVVDLSFERAPQGNLKFDFGASQLPATPIYLDDKYTHTQTLVSSSLVYSFNVSSDAASYAENRFSLILNKGTTGLTTLNGGSEKLISLYPNPATTAINLQINAPSNATYTYVLLNQLGEELSKGSLNFNGKNTQSLNIETLSNGVYFVKVVSGTSSQTIKFIK